ICPHGRTGKNPIPGGLAERRSGGMLDMGSMAGVPSRHHDEEVGNMHILPHDVDHEFPEFVPLIHKLRGSDERLAKLLEEYERVNGEIVDIEENDKPFQEFEFEAMKKRRLKLKDEIYFILRGHQH
ncbi:MAG: YdcH family protein, partial [Burkholderiales bacterium]